MSFPRRRESRKNKTGYTLKGTSPACAGMTTLIVIADIATQSRKLESSNTEKLKIR
jgi:hypothetical protein